MIAKVIGILTLIGLLFGIYFTIESKFASAQDVQSNSELIQQVQKSINSLSNQFQYNKLQAMKERRVKKVWAIEDRYGINLRTAPKHIKDDYRSIKLEIERLEKDMKKLEAKE